MSGRDTRSPRGGWKRRIYLAHRWIGVAVGGFVLCWFLSGIALMYYPWPALTESRALATLQPLPSQTPVIGFLAAATAATAVAGGRPATPFVGGRLSLWGGRLVYRLWRGRHDGNESDAVIDARTGVVLSPIDSAIAVAAARDVAGRATPLAAVDLLARGDQYLMGSAYAAAFSAYRVRFGDAPHTAVYVGRMAGDVVGVVTDRTRLTTWLGTVPHWLYFQWLYSRPALWTAANLLLPSIAVLLALSGIVVGTTQLLPQRLQGDWRITASGGVSRWHHLAGVAFGVLVLTWTTSGVLEMLGPSSDPRAVRVLRARGVQLDWSTLRVAESTAVRLALQAQPHLQPVAVDLRALGSHFGYHVRDAARHDVWVDAASGALRGELTATDARRVAGAVIGVDVRVRRVDRLTRYDAQYYARHGRERHLPVWRLETEGDSAGALYLDCMTGVPVGFVNEETRTWRWVRDAVHTLDFPALNDRRPLWDAVALCLLVGGGLTAVTGVWLMLRRACRRVGDSL